MPQISDTVSATKKHFTTGEVAALCAVTPNTVYKWIRSGRFPAHRTPGGHHRISREVTLQLLRAKGVTSSVAAEDDSFLYCWQFNAKDGLVSRGCRACIVYRSRTRRCYEMSRLPQEAGHSGLYCEDSCEECEYYRLVRGQRPNVLVITNRSRVQDSLRRSCANSDFNLELTDCEYRCSMLIDRFRPDFVVVDCSLGSERSRQFARLLNEDPRIPLVRIVLVGSREQLPQECDKLVFALVKQRLTASILMRLVALG